MVEEIFKKMHRGKTLKGREEDTRETIKAISINQTINNLILDFRFQN